MSSPPTTRDRSSVARRDRRVDRCEVGELIGPDARHPRSVENGRVLPARQALARGHRTLIADEAAGRLAVLVQVDEHLQGGRILFRVEVAGGRGQVGVGDVAAARPDPRHEVPGAEAAVGEERDAGAVEALGRRLEFVEGRGRRARPCRRERVGVGDQHAGVGVERQAVVVALPEVGGEHPGERAVGELLEVVHLLREGHEHSEVGEPRHPSEVGANEVGQLVAGSARGELLEQVVVGHVEVFDLDSRVRLLERGDEGRLERILLGRVAAVAVRAPEGDGDGPVGIVAAAGAAAGGDEGDRHGGGTRRDDSGRTLHCSLLLWKGFPRCEGSTHRVLSMAKETPRQVFLFRATMTTIASEVELTRADR